MKILVTGAAGFIGYHLCEKLISLGFDVVGIDNINDYYDPALKYARLFESGINNESEKWYIKIQSSKHSKYRFVRMNLEDRDQLNQLFETERFDKVCNLAAQAGVRYSLENPHAYINSNIVGFINILEACRHHNIKHLVYASSSSVYGNNTKMPLSTNDNVDYPISLYAATKKSNELMAHTYSHLYNLPTTGLRFFTVYGPWGRPDMAYFKFTKAILNDEAIPVFNNGNLYRDFTYIDDIIEGLARVLDRAPSKNETVGLNMKVNYEIVAPYKVYNIGNSSPVLLKDFIVTIEKELDMRAKINFLPMQLGDVIRTYADVTELIKEFDFKPNTSIQKGIEKFVEWYNMYVKS